MKTGGFHFFAGKKVVWLAATEIWPDFVATPFIAPVSSVDPRSGALDRSLALLVR